MYEDNLIPLFETIGVVVQFRLMMNYSGRNRGFGYIIFLDPNDGYRAISQLNNILVSSWCRLQLSVSKNTRRLWLGNVNEDFDVDTIIHMILEKIDPQEVRSSTKSTRFCKIFSIFAHFSFQISISHRFGQPCFIIKFATHRDAAISRKILLREIMDFGTLARTNWDFQESQR